MTEPLPIFDPAILATVRTVRVREHERRVPVEPHNYGPPAQIHSDTSVAAAQSVRGKTEALRRRVLACLMANGPLTDEQIQRFSELPASTERPRRVELVRDGRVRDSGERRATASGRSAVVWMASE